MVKTNRIRKGFSLVELVVVILIMGVLAAVAAPKMFDKAGDAKINGTKQSLSVIRDAIEMYKNDSPTGQYPANAAALLTGLSPYIKGPFPKNTINGGDGPATAVDKTSFSAVSTGGEDWLYDNSTSEGKIAINSDGHLAD